MQVEEHEGEEWDSVTKLHQDMSDAVNVLVHTQPDPPPTTPAPTSPCTHPASGAPSTSSVPLAAASMRERQGLQPLWEAPQYPGAGALWDIWRACDVDDLRAYLRAHVAEFMHHGERLSAGQVRGHGSQEGEGAGMREGVLSDLWLRAILFSHSLLPHSSHSF